MDVPGKWTLFYDWDCVGSYSQVVMTLYNDGNWAAPGYKGRWVQTQGMFMFTFNDVKTTYAGSIAGKSITGIMTTFGSTHGCFYMLQDGVPTSFDEKRPAGTFDFAGQEGTALE